jgi:succinate dehydrogenase / fumarate reductase, membrane anchor subunit
METTVHKPRSVNVPGNLESISWKWMRISALLLIPLVWVHVILQDVIVGVHAMDLNYVAFRWASLFWRVYDGLLLAFAFAHGVNGLRQILFDFIYGPRARQTVIVLLLLFWLGITVFGFVALIAGVNTPFPLK